MFWLHSCGLVHRYIHWSLVWTYTGHYDVTVAMAATDSLSLQLHDTDLYKTAVL